ncbi:MAG: ABC transporter permease, partial [Bacteroidota bacterium]
MKYEFFIARRYFFAAKSKHFIGIISFLSMLGICIGVAALVTILSVFNGFNTVVTDVLVGFDPHIKIEGKGKAGITDEQKIFSALNIIPTIISYSAFIEQKALLQSREGNQVVYVKGVDAQTVGNVSGVKEKIVLGKFV